MKIVKKYIFANLMAYILCFISSCNESEEILNCNTEKESSFVENLKVDINIMNHLTIYEQSIILTVNMITLKKMPAPILQNIC